MKKLTVSVVIPAHNESKNIERFLLSVIGQKSKLFKLDEIILICDGCTDDTGLVAKSLAKEFRKIKVIDDQLRKGKPERLNEAFKYSESDVVVAFDADVVLESENVIDNLVEPFVFEKLSGFTSGQAIPLAPINFVQKIAFTGVQIWNDIRKNTSSKLFLCEGSIRAFSKSLYKDLTFPNTSADDAYPYLAIQKTKHQFRYVPNAKTFYRLPLSITDYINQQLRYQSAPLIYSFTFGHEEFNSLWSIRFLDRVEAFMNRLFKNPITTIEYFLFFIFIKLIFKIQGPNFSSKWRILNSTK
jgi:cellulose synthase/poly-beta-1,6-N-acetylglucosamine synthase-like glycosyltransferase